MNFCIFFIVAFCLISFSFGEDHYHHHNEHHKGPHHHWKHHPCVDGICSKGSKIVSLVTGTPEVKAGPNYIPEVTLWSDGTIVWTKTTEEIRQVNVGKISPSLVTIIEKLMDKIEQVDTIWNPKEENTECILDTRTKRHPKAYCNSALEGFDSVMKILLTLSSQTLEAKPLQPKRAYVCHQEAPQVETGLAWTGPDVKGCKWLGGEDLALAWKGANEETVFFNVDQEYFRLSVQVPNISFTHPKCDRHHHRGHHRGHHRNGVDDNGSYGFDVEGGSGSLGSRVWILLPFVCGALIAVTVAVSVICIRKRRQDVPLGDVSEWTAVAGNDSEEGDSSSSDEYSE